MLFAAIALMPSSLHKTTLVVVFHAFKRIVVIAGHLGTTKLWLLWLVLPSCVVPDFEEGALDGSCPTQSSGSGIVVPDML